MVAIERHARVVAAIAAIGVNVVVGFGLAALAQHYEREALQAASGNAPLLAAGALRCRSEPARAG